MSSRHFRKICGTTLPPPDSDDSEAEYNPRTNRLHVKSTYEGLELSSSSEGDSHVQNSDEDDQEDVKDADSLDTASGMHKNKKKKRARGKKHNATKPPQPGTSLKELDEIDRSLKEVNDLLGEPSPVQNIGTQAQNTEAGVPNSILGIQVKHLNVGNELRKLFGPDEPEDIRLRNKTQPHRERLLKRVLIRPTNDTIIYDFKKRGLSMSIEKREGDIIYFVYNHDKDHQRLHEAFLQRYHNYILSPAAGLLNLEDYRRNMHVEPLLVMADSLFRMDENSMANEIIENVVTCLQYVAHPSFNLAKTNVRLSYEYLENRPFHVAMLKYMYLLTNKACHRTALEIAKMLLNIDPSDPLAVLIIIDTLALRSREHQWLIEAIDHFNETRQANLLVNFQYSYALAHFHVAIKNNSTLAEADNCLQRAIMMYPHVVLKIMEFGNMNEPRIQNHDFYINQAGICENIRELVLIYTKLTCARWREPQVMEWFIRNAIAVAESFDTSVEVKDRIMQLSIARTVFRVWPAEISRHIAVIRPMANLLLETHLSPPRRPTSAWDPTFDQGHNRYSYIPPIEPPRNPARSSRALIYEFFASMMPGADIDLDMLGED